MSTSGRLRELIRAVRGCKTAAEERGLIQRECAQIRQAFKEGRESSRSANMLKLLYITMLGYHTEFGQMEVVKLIAQSDYGGKRVGYLTLAVVLDETQEVLTLAENHLKKDLVNSNSFIQALALDVVANIAGEDMSRDVLHEVEQLVDSHNLYLKRKACLAALRIVKKAPDHAEIFLEKSLSMFNERNQGALMCNLALVNQCLLTEQGDSYLQKYRQLVTAAVRVLKQLVLSSKVTDQDIGGVSDPFLQIKLLQFLRITGKGSAATSEAMNDVLAQVATNTDSSKNVGSAVHYECVKTINAIEADSGLRVLGINTVGRFLTSNKDNNVRYVALTTLQQLVTSDLPSVLRHHATVIDCLKDPDLSIRRRALELTVALIDHNSVRILVPDLIQYLHACSADVQPEVAEQIAGVVESKYPSPEWRVELSIRLFKVARHNIPLAFAVSFVAFVSQQPRDLQRAAVMGIWEEFCGPFDASLQSCVGLLVAALWLCGEFPDFIVTSGVAPEDVASACATAAMNSAFGNVKQYGLTALMKLATKYRGVKQIALSVFDAFASNLDCELQQRACEYTTMLDAFGEVSQFCFSAMPPIFPSDEDVGAVPDSAVTVAQSGPGGSGLPAPAAARQSAIDDLFGGPAAAAPTAVAAPTPAAPATAKKPVDLGADDLFGPSPAPKTSSAGHGAADLHPLDVLTQPRGPPATSTSSGGGGGGAVVDIFGPPVSSAVPPTGPSAKQVFQWDEGAVSVVARFAAPATIHAVLMLSATSARLQQVAFHVAVPRTSSIEVLPLASNVAAPGQPPLVQKIVVTSSDPAKAHQLTLRVKLVYSVASGVVKEQLFQVSHDVV